MKLSDFNYRLPKGLIADYPQAPRDSCRLMVVDRKKNTIEHRTFKDILSYFSADDLLVLNDTRVLKARLIGKKPSGGKVDVLLLERISPTDFKVLIKPSDLKIDTRIIFNDGLIQAWLIQKGLIRFSTDNLDKIYAKGMMPLPPYIKRIPQTHDEVNYQTVFARYDGAVASPTAGLHFTKGLLSEIERKNIKIAYATLHINYATFKPVKEEDILKHKMYKEYYKVNKPTLDLIESTRQKKKKIIAVGTTSARVLETIMQELKGERYKRDRQYEGWTDLFIFPGYRFRLLDCLLTNFHLPLSTLLILVTAFAGKELIMRAYQEAIDKKYRFYSYGDAMLII
jgi:S-adenosylmethionine:tRNA ribosyltransferase-isomerase